VDLADDVAEDAAAVAAESDALVAADPEAVSGSDPQTQEPDTAAVTPEPEKAPAIVDNVINIDDAAAMATLSKDQLWALLQAHNDDLIAARKRFDRSCIESRRGISELERQVRKLEELHRR